MPDNDPGSLNAAQLAAQHSPEELARMVVSHRRQAVSARQHARREQDKALAAMKDAAEQSAKAAGLTSRGSQRPPSPKELAAEIRLHVFNELPVPDDLKRMFSRLQLAQMSPQQRADYEAGRQR
ncbi:hypothetical protein J7W19_21050 [Streptomyces mobaraensis NBRC 13819 = DSM 40847]|nr:hypothetical protein [Streptomyces mobaraensis]QTT75535.1 hypothetical protein J7W19_21050 [Streptomyces mobaraensis NBRC 13819 = DSM 40847]